MSHGAQMGKGTAQQPAYMHTSLFTSLLSISPSLFFPFTHLDPSVSPPWSPCLLADKQPNYLITFSSWAPGFVTSTPKCETSDAATQLISAMHGIANTVTLVFLALQAFLSKGSPPALGLPPQRSPQVKRSRSSWRGLLHPSAAHSCSLRQFPPSHPAHSQGLCG